MPAPYRLAICMPMARGPHPTTQRNLLMLEDVRPYHFVDRVGLPVDMARNQITEQVLKLDDVTHFLWIDDDMTFPRDAAKRLLAHDLPIVGGLCHNRRHPFMPILMYLTQDRGFTYRYDYPEGLVEVDATGAAFLLVKKEVMKDIHEKCNTARGEEPWTQAMGTTEDVAFCMRAAKAGYKIVVDTTLKIGHFGESVVDEDFAKRNRKFKARPWHPTNQEPPVGAPVATIVIPTFKQDKYKLHAAVRSALDQTVPVEIIVIDNDPEGSAARDLAELGIESPHFRVLTNETNGMLWRSLNRGVKEMTTDWFCWLSSDDMFYANKVEQQLFATKMANEKASFHSYDVMPSDHVILPQVVLPPEWTTMKEQQHLLAHGCFINGNTTMIHRKVFEKVGVFDPTLEIVSDWEFWNRVGREFFWLPITEVLATRRDYDNASNLYAKDPVKRAQWIAEDNVVRAKYTALLQEG